MMTSRSLASSLVVLFGLAACSSDSSIDSQPKTDLQMSKLVSIRVAGFVESAGIT